MRQRVLAAFGDFVLDNEDLDAILTEGCRLIAEALGTNLAKVIEIENGQDTGLIRAGIGWHDGIIGKERISLSERSSEAHAIKTSEPVITNDIADESRFHFPEFLREHGVVAIINVPIFLPGRKPWGILQVDARCSRHFDRDDIDFLKTYAMVLGPVIDRLQVVAERDRIQRETTQRDARLRRVLDEMGEGFCVLAPDFTILEHNQKALRLTAERPETVIGKSSWEIYPDLEHSEVGRVLKKAMVDRERVFMEYEYSSQTSGPRWLNLRAYPTGDGGLALVWRDVTKRRKAQEKLQKSEEWLRNAIEVGKIGLWDWNVLTGEVHWSEEHYRMQGYAVDEVAPSYQAWLDRLHPDKREIEDETILACMETGDDYASEFRVVHPSGAVHWLRVRARFFYDDERKPIRMVGAAIDVTEARDMQERQSALVAELQHRTRNLIGVVRSMADRTARSSSDYDQFRDKFRDRLGAMARVQGLLSRLGDDDRVTFEELIETELVALNGDENGGGVSLEGPRGIRLRSSTVQTLAMALHELATNALKYGALNQSDARLAVTWHYKKEGVHQRPWLHVDWREAGVKMPNLGSDTQKSGNGRELIERGLPYQLGARTSFKLGSDGVHCTLSIPVSQTSGVQEKADG